MSADFASCSAPNLCRAARSRSIIISDSTVTISSARRARAELASFVSASTLVLSAHCCSYRSPVMEERYDESSMPVTGRSPGSARNYDRRVKAVIYSEPGGAEVLRYEEVPDPEPGAGDVVVRVAACAL